ncbi:hypothetical protein KSS87_005712 [Heliosperma pusillum]|nr:hypothetical protein KSS87_005712 [Heliosperma pusillum]
MTEGKTRGSNMLHDVHMRPYKKRKAIFLNEFGQPFGPITEKQDTVSEFSPFLGTIAQDYGYAPFVYNTWRKVPNKEKMWEYVLEDMKNYVPLEDGSGPSYAFLGVMGKEYDGRRRLYGRDKCREMEEQIKKNEELEKTQLDLDNMRENMTQQILRKLLEKLPPEVVRHTYLRGVNGGVGGSLGLFSFYVSEGCSRLCVILVGWSVLNGVWS